MVEINKNTTIKAVKKTDIKEGVVTEATEYTELNQVQDDLKGFEARLNSMMHKNDTLQEKLTIVNKEQMTLVIPKSFIKDAIEQQINKMQDDILDQVKTANDVLRELRLVENQSALQDLEDLSSWTDRLDEVEYKLDDKAEHRDIDDEIDNRLYDYKEEYEIDAMIEEAINNIDDVSEVENKLRENIMNNHDMLVDQIVELNSKVDALTAKNNNIVSRVLDWFKSLFTPQRND